MQQSRKVIEKLQISRYLTASTDVTGSISNIELLVNGLKYSEQILNHWRLTHSLDKEVDANFMNFNGNDYVDDPINRISFIHSKPFYEGFKYLFSKADNQRYQAVLKTIQTETTGNSNIVNECLVPHSRKRIFLVTDLITRQAQGFNKFFNSQRECKIWWMRFSSDPSKYFLDPYDFKEVSNSAHIPTGTQSITIKSKLPYATLDVESITFVPLTGAHLDKSVSHFSKNSDQNIPAVIRSVIDLHAATSAILFDSVDNDRENTLLLNRKLAPFQCAVACLNEGEQLSDLKDLYLHLQFVLKRSGLRLMSENISGASRKELEIGLQKCDCLGIPYILIIDESTLMTGLLSLRSRDTTLEETIHISDIPGYLLQIFSS
ncbi:DNA polymerase subunit gamma-2, mitochondrial [Anastrepha obliqua]|uniref:DNA polymerase subunit gamma-2, mitochondrial n=1 Tax=Anastrepha obliqua TaxID=95512 RepID=UPI0024091F21|nr:DNA polymerase subunit gamma-2, mitochondrial [Anastrepha obliqua]